VVAKTGVIAPHQSDHTPAELGPQPTADKVQAVASVCISSLARSSAARGELDSLVEILGSGLLDRKEHVAGRGVREKGMGRGLLSDRSTSETPLLGSPKTIPWKSPLLEGG